MTARKHARVLRLVNAARKGMKLKALKELPKGHTGLAHCCPLAIALRRGCDVNVRTELMWFGGYSHKEDAEAARKAWRTRPATQYYPDCSIVLLPGSLKTFVSRFDRGAYPELIERTP